MPSVVVRVDLHVYRTLVIIQIAGQLVSGRDSASVPIIVRDVVRALLDAGLVQHLHSPNASPTGPVRRCVDFAEQTVGIVETPLFGLAQTDWVVENADSDNEVASRNSLDLR
jgi:ribulose-5-phosphate 4-epimerase/fuculose-1-phosphate aldolase